MPKFRMPADPSLRHTIFALRPMLTGKGLGLFIGSCLAVAVLEVAAVGMLPAFLAALTEPRLLFERAGLRNLEFLGAATDDEIVIAFGAAVAAFFVLKNLFIASVAWFQAAFVANKQATLSARLLSAYVHQPYTYHLQRNSSDLVANATGVVFNIFSGVVLPAAIVLTESIVVVLVTCLLLLVNPVVSLLAIGLTGGLSFAFYSLFRTRLRRIGEHQHRDRTAMFKWVVQTLGGIKETILLGRQQFFVDAFARHVVAYSRSNVVLQTIATLPRLFVEAVVICILVLVVVVLVLVGTRMSEVFPTLALFGVAALRLMPSATRIVGALSTIRFHQPSVETVVRDIGDAGFAPRTAQRTDLARVSLSSHIEARALSYTYEGATSPALREVSLRIDKGWMVAFVGRSGAGKSTLVDILIGLHLPSSGAVLVDGSDIANNTSAWQRNIGYVPQSIFLSDDSLRRNVAFGLDDALIDDGDVLRAIEAAQLGEFVSSLPKGLDTVIGERGSRISGGQRQRIGIARALYGNPEVLVLDEPTTALDRPTAEDLTTVLVSLAGRKTVLLIAHQMSSVRHCKHIFLLRNGTLAAEGAYEDLAISQPEFQSLVE
jgi:ABC-type multidrug transport system fused ATPase/permease subunit